MTPGLQIFNHVVLAYFLAINAIYTLLLALSYRASRHELRQTALGGFDSMLRSPLTLPVSVLMPAYNEENTIVEAVNALRLLEYGEYEIVVVDDGSTDGMLRRLIDAFDLHQVKRPLRISVPCAPVSAVYLSRQVPNLTVISKANGGKADALNAGINAARFPLFCAIDADAILEPEALLRVVRPFMVRPRETMASSGIIRVVNGCRVADGRVTEIRTPRNPLAALQVVEYLRAFLGSRTGWSELKALFVISGAFGVFKREAVIGAGGYRKNTVGEDMDLVLRLHRMACDRGDRYRIVYIPDPVVWTEAPEQLAVLRRQRNRWHRGLLECLSASRSMIGRPKYRTLGLLGLPYNLVFEAIGPLLEVAGFVSVAIAIAMGRADVTFIALFFLMAVGYGVFLSVAAILLDQMSPSGFTATRDLRRLLFYAVLENFGYRQLQAIWRLRATVDFLRKKSSWGEMRRKGFDTA